MQKEPVYLLSIVNIYLVHKAGSYMGVSAITDIDEHTTFSLPSISYKIRADHLSQQFWSDPFIQTDVTIEVPYSVANVHVTDTGADVAGAPVYVFNGSSAYLGIYGTTDTYGMVSFDLPAGTYRFRADVSGSQYWTDAVSLIAHQENQVDMPLDLLALTRTPTPGKIFHGQPPKAPKMKKHAKDPVLLASIGSLSGILANAAQAQLPDDVLYFINDHLGTPAKVMDDDGVVVWDADYLPFGETNVLTGTFDNKFRFPGQYLDDETGWYYNYYRYYSPGVGRYLRPDPIKLLGGINLFCFSNNNNLLFVDRYGLCPVGWEQVGNECWPKDGGPCGYGRVDDGMGSCVEWRPKLFSKQFNIGECSLWCIVAAAIGGDLPPITGELTTQTWYYIGKWALKEAKRTGLKTIIIKGGSHVLPGIGLLSSGITAVKFVSCYIDCCEQ